MEKEVKAKKKFKFKPVKGTPAKGDLVIEVTGKGTRLEVLKVLTIVPGRKRNTQGYIATVRYIGQARPHRPQVYKCLHKNLVKVGPLGRWDRVVDLFKAIFTRVPSGK